MSSRPEPDQKTVIADLAASDLDAVHDLWLSLHRFHAEIGSTPLVADEAAAWASRRAQYARWLEAGEAFALLARRGPEALGYAVVHLQDGPDDTFPLGERWAEIYTLAVAPTARGQGIGSSLLDAVDARLGTLGIRAVAVAAMVENEAALRLYRRRGFVPREIVLYRFATEEGS